MSGSVAVSGSVAELIDVLGSVICVVRYGTDMIKSGAIVVGCEANVVGREANVVGPG